LYLVKFKTQYLKDPRQQVEGYNGNTQYH